MLKKSDFAWQADLSGSHIWEYMEFIGLPIVDVLEIEVEDFQIIEPIYWAIKNSLEERAV